MTTTAIETADGSTSREGASSDPDGSTTFHDAKTNEVLGSVSSGSLAVGDGVVGFGRRRFRVVDRWLCLDEGGPLAVGIHLWIREVVHPAHPADPTVAAMSASPTAPRHDEPLRFAPEYFAPTGAPRGR